MSEEAIRPSVCFLVLTDPESGAGSPAGNAIFWIGKLALLQRQTPASDALSQPCSKAFQFGNSLVDATGPGTRQLRPIRALGNVVLRQLGQLSRNFLQSQAYLLRKDDEGDSAQRRPGIAAMASRSASLRLD